jgi:hypothetical protein
LLLLLLLFLPDLLVDRRSTGFSSLGPRDNRTKLLTKISRWNNEWLTDGGRQTGNLNTLKGLVENLGATVIGNCNLADGPISIGCQGNRHRLTSRKF